jgi:hypothetical protein
LQIMRGSAPFKPTGVQVPTAFATTQDMQAPVQAESQQTPSTQLPNAHWLGAAGLHVSPFFFFVMHVPPGPLQYVPPAQSMSVEHVFAQAPALQRNGAHSVEPALQTPVLHLPASVSVDVLAQVADEHTVSSGYFWQLPLPSHLPFVPQLMGPWSVHLLLASTVPAAIGAQAPVPERLQASQPGHAAEPQQTPSTQKVLEHSSPLTQLLPLAFCGTQLPPTPVQ